jgi:hypothetical protein
MKKTKEVSLDSTILSILESNELKVEDVLLEKAFNLIKIDKSKKYVQKFNPIYYKSGFLSIQKDNDFEFIYIKDKKIIDNTIVFKMSDGNLINISLFEQLYNEHPSPENFKHKPIFSDNVESVNSDSNHIDPSNFFTVNPFDDIVDGILKTDTKGIKDYKIKNKLKIFKSYRIEVVVSDDLPSFKFNKDVNYKLRDGFDQYNIKFEKINEISKNPIFIVELTNSKADELFIKNTSKYSGIILKNDFISSRELFIIDNGEEIFKIPNRNKIILLNNAI